MPLVVTIAFRSPAAGAVSKFTANKVDVADTTVPVAPESNTTVLLPAVVSKPKPTIKICDALALSIEPTLAVTTGETPVTCTAEPLLMVLVLTDAFSAPASDGLLTKVTVNEVDEAAVTLPVAPLSNVTVLLPGVGSNPKPLIVMVFALAVISPVGFAVTAGITVATCTGAPLTIESVVTTDVKVPAIVGSVDKVTINVVGVAEVTVPAAPLLKVITLSVAVVSNPKPAIVTVVAFAAKFAVLLVTTGRTFAT